jgi:hypothetical protein
VLEGRHHVGIICSDLLHMTVYLRQQKVASQVKKKYLPFPSFYSSFPLFGLFFISLQTLSSAVFSDPLDGSSSYDFH